MNKIILQNSQGIEFPKWIANFYHADSDCATLEVPHPVLKKNLKDEKTALDIFQNELDQNVGALSRDSLFFGSISDPFLSETTAFHLEVLKYCRMKGVPVMALTKQVGVESKLGTLLGTNTSIGFSLNPRDEHEPGAASIKQRISAMAWLHNRGLRTFANIDQVVDLNYTMELIEDFTRYCDLLIIGIDIDSNYYQADLRRFYDDVLSFTAPGSKVFWNNSILKQLDLNRNDLVKTNREGNFIGKNVNKDWSIFWDFHK